ncbi:DegV family protein [Streptococcus sp. CSL10205-OR2]|uniref:DegV family protein n=1 Tax=Streptococcus sp. CSL10205-OR2 TaxID=2980558 RepID=UPI0021DA0270|nr:DegV family protein [Streptococcus sp. CSL10205-OR2]MCU9534372.1 DegV family protein [Streptococcus sp. CSL10205-OR2]
MKLAVITDSSAFLDESLKKKDNVFVLDIPVIIDNESFIEGKNLEIEEFYQKLEKANDFPTTSQPNLADLDDILAYVTKENYTHVIGLFLSSGISGFYQNIHYLVDEYSHLTISFPDTKTSSFPLGILVKNTINAYEKGLSFSDIDENLRQQINQTGAYVIVDDLNHLVKGGRLSNGSALIGNLLSIKPIIYFNNGKLELYERVRTEKKAHNRLIEILNDVTSNGSFDVSIVHANAFEKAKKIRDLVSQSHYQGNISITPFSSVIAAHLGKGAVAIAFSPSADDE